MTEQLPQDGPNEIRWTPVPAERYVSVWPHTLGEFEKFLDAVATVDAGVLYIWRSARRGPAPLVPDKSQPPLKVYAPGYWATFEHVGDYNLPDHGSHFLQSPAERHPILVGRTLAQEAIHQAGLDPENYLPPETPAEKTSELPPVPADPFAELDEDRLAQTNGDVGKNTGVGVIPPYPKGQAGGGVAAPKDEAAPDDDAESPDTDVSMAQYVFGEWLEGLRDVRRALSRGVRRLHRPRMPEPLPTHRLGSAPPRSRSAAFALTALFPLGLLILTQLH